MTRYEPGTPSWCDLGVGDIDAAARFYGELFGWDVQEAGPAEETGGYHMAFVRGKPIAGLGPQQNPGPPYWTTYVSVDDADGTAKLVRDNGGMVFLEPMDVLTVGRMAIFADPTGAAFAVWQPGDHVGAGIVNEPGTMCWNELATRDIEAAKAFYGAVFGWGGETHPMPPDGSYTEWELGGRTIGGMMEMGSHMPAEVPPHWLVYFAVEDCDAATARATSLGGGVTAGPMDIDAGRFAVVRAPQGEMFGVIALSAERTGD